MTAEQTDSSNPRGCYCGSVSEEFRSTHGLSNEFCGVCERCGKPGHMRHFPGPLPYTGAWCDRCYTIVAWTWPLRNPLVWLVVGALALAIGWPFLSHK